MRLRRLALRLARRLRLARQLPGRLRGLLRGLRPRGLALRGVRVRVVLLVLAHALRGRRLLLARAGALRQTVRRALLVRGRCTLELRRAG